MKDDYLCLRAITLLIPYHTVSLIFFRHLKLTLMDNNPQNQESRTSLIKLIALIIIYLFLTFSSRYSEHQLHHGISISEKIMNEHQQIKLQDLATLYEFQEQYTGLWQKTRDNNDLKEVGLMENKGELQMMISRASSFKGNQRYNIRFVVSNGEYIDDGVLEVNILLEVGCFTSVRTNNQTLSLKLSKPIQLDGSYNFRKLLNVEDEGPIKVTDFVFDFILLQEQKIQTIIDISFTTEDQNSIRNGSLKLKPMDHQRRLLKLIVCAIVIFMVSYIPFIAALDLLKKFYEGNTNPLHYSLFTITVATMWDTVLSMVAFKMAFTDQESLVLFIMPAFMLCLLFTNIEPRLMFMIFERNQHPDRPGRYCNMFNLISYGSLILIYPIMMVTNLNRSIFIGISCLLFPQIYLNAVHSNRPQYTDDYYVKFLFTRFILVLYLRCFPYNVFDMQPDYPLGILCIALISLQFTLLQLQNKYGPKIVVPKWMLEAAFDYNYQQAFNLQQFKQDNDCSICLLSLCTEPPDGEGQVSLPFRLMKTPCKHTYHSSCLISWMKIKMECPQCRSVLPPYQ